MGGSDLFCTITGARFFYEPGEFRDVIISDWDSPGDKDEEDTDEDTGDEDTNSTDEDETENANEDDAEQNSEGDVVDTKGREYDISDAVWDGLLYSQEDVDSSSNFVLLVPYTVEDGKVVLQDEFGSSRPEEVMESNIMEIFNVVPGDDPESGDYQNEDDGTVYTVLCHGTTLIMMYTSYLILKQASPGLKSHIIYDLAFHSDEYFNGCVPGVDYGPVNGIQDQHANWLGVTGISDVDEQIEDWKRMLTNKGKTDEEILYEVWRGRGNMWAFVRPDRFPVAETLTANPLLVVSGYSSIQMNLHQLSTFDGLPLDILILICQCLPVKSAHMVLCTNRRLRSQILPHANTIAYHHITAYEPHLLPVGPFVLKDPKHGREEVDWWEAQWAKGNIPKEELSAKIPWFLYRRECSKSMSMWNRRRIWGIAEQLESLAVERGLLD